MPGAAWREAARTAIRDSGEIGRRTRSQCRDAIGGQITRDLETECLQRIRRRGVALIERDTLPAIRSCPGDDEPAGFDGRSRDRDAGGNSARACEPRCDQKPGAKSMCENCYHVRDLILATERDVAYGAVTMYMPWLCRTSNCAGVDPGIPSY